MIYNTGDLVLFIADEDNEEYEFGVVVIQYDNYDTEVLFACGGSFLVDGWDVQNNFLIPLGAL